MDGGLSSAYPSASFSSEGFADPDLVLENLSEQIGPCASRGPRPGLQVWNRLPRNRSGKAGHASDPFSHGFGRLLFCWPMVKAKSVSQLAAAFVR